MRKAFVAVIFVFISIAAVLVLTEETGFQEVSILSIKQSYSRLITEETETIAFPVYLSTDKSFISNIESISSIYLANDLNQIEVQLSSIVDMNYTEELDGKTYHLYLYEIYFDMIQIDEISIQDTNMLLSFQNSDEIEIYLGDISIRFQDVIGSNYIDIDRVYTTSSITSNMEYVTGIVIGIENMTMQDVVINEITIGCEDVLLDLQNMITVIDEIPYNQNINDLMGYDYDPIMTNIETNKPFDLNDYNLVFIPLKYFQEITPIRRFPIFLRYTYMNQEYEYIMDDFRFISENYSLGEHHGRIHETIYYYQ